MKLKLMPLLILTAICVNSFAIKRKNRQFIPDTRFTLRDVKNVTDKSVYIAFDKEGASGPIRQDIEIPAKSTASLLTPILFAQQNIQTQKIEIATYYDIDTHPALLILTITKDEHPSHYNSGQRNVQIKAELVAVDPMNDDELGKLSTVNKNYLLVTDQKDYYFIDIFLSGNELRESNISLTQEIINP